MARRSKCRTVRAIIPPNSPAPVLVLTVHGAADAVAIPGSNDRLISEKTMKFTKCIVAYLMTMSALAAPLEAPLLFQTRYTTRGSATRLERLIATCRNMPLKDVKEIQVWLSTGKWEKGGKAIIRLRSAGSFVFMKPVEGKCWVITLQADCRHLLVQTGTVNSARIITIDERSLRSVENIRIAKLLERQIESYSPSGKGIIDELARLLRE